MKIAADNEFTPTAAPSLLRALGSSVAWALGCGGGWVVAQRWANECRAFESGTQGGGQLVLLLAVVLAGAVLLHTQAYKKFERVYLAQGASQRPDQLAIAWLLVLSVLRTVWLLAVLVLALCVFVSTGEPDAGWR